nr:MAG TPA: hypothetical protein [Caudoviricetes sp.]
MNTPQPAGNIKLQKPQGDGPHIHHPAASVLPGCDRGTPLPTNSLNVPAGQFSFCYPVAPQGFHPGGAVE